MAAGSLSPAHTDLIPSSPDLPTIAHMLRTSTSPMRLWPSMVFWTFLLLYLVGIYVLAATASLYDSYQPGIEAFKRWLQPGLLLTAALAFACFGKSLETAKLTQRLALAALTACGLLLLVIAQHESSPRIGHVWPEQRTLGSTLMQALFQPSFSGRSKLTSMVSGLWALLVLLVASWRTRRLRKQAQERPPGPAATEPLFIKTANTATTAPPRPPQSPRALCR